MDFQQGDMGERRQSMDADGAFLIPSEMFLTSLAANQTHLGLTSLAPQTLQQQAPQPQPQPPTNGGLSDHIARNISQTMAQWAQGLYSSGQVQDVQMVEAVVAAASAAASAAAAAVIAAAGESVQAKMQEIAVQGSSLFPFGNQAFPGLPPMMNAALLANPPLHGTLMHLDQGLGMGGGLLGLPLGSNASLLPSSWIPNSFDHDQAAADPSKGGIDWMNWNSAPDSLVPPNPHNPPPVAFHQGGQGPAPPLIKEDPSAPTPPNLGGSDPLAIATTKPLPPRLLSQPHTTSGRGSEAGVQVRVRGPSHAHKAGVTGTNGGTGTTVTGTGTGTATGTGTGTGTRVSLNDNRCSDHLGGQGQGQRVGSFAAPPSYPQGVGHLPTPGHPHPHQGQSNRAVPLPPRAFDPPQPSDSDHARIQDFILLAGNGGNGGNGFGSSGDGGLGGTHDMGSGGGSGSGGDASGGRADGKAEGGGSGSGNRARASEEEPGGGASAAEEKEDKGGLDPHGQIHGQGQIQGQGQLPSSSSSLWNLRNQLTLMQQFINTAQQSFKIFADRDRDRDRDADQREVQPATTQGPKAQNPHPGNNGGVQPGEQGSKGRAGGYHHHHHHHHHYHHHHGEGDVGSHADGGKEERQSYRSQEEEGGRNEVPTNPSNPSNPGGGTNPMDCAPAPAPLLVEDAGPSLPSSSAPLTLPNLGDLQLPLALMSQGVDSLVNHGVNNATIQLATKAFLGASQGERERARVREREAGCPFYLTSSHIRCGDCFHASVLTFTPSGLNIAGSLLSVDPSPSPALGGGGGATKLTHDLIQQQQQLQQLVQAQRQLHQQLQGKNKRPVSTRDREGGEQEEEGRVGKMARSGLEPNASAFDPGGGGGMVNDTQRKRGRDFSEQHGNNGGIANTLPPSNAAGRQQRRHRGRHAARGSSISRSVGSRASSSGFQGAAVAAGGGEEATCPRHRPLPNIEGGGGGGGHAAVDAASVPPSAANPNPNPNASARRCPSNNSGSRGGPHGQGSIGQEGGGGSRGTGDIVSGSDVGSNEPGSVPPGEDAPSRSQPPSASDLGMMGAAARRRAAAAAHPETVLQVSCSLIPSSDPPQAQDAGGAMNPAPNIGHLTWPGHQPGGTARAAQAKEEGLSREPQQETQGQAQAQAQAGVVLQLQAEAQAVAAAGPLVSTVAYLGEQQQGAGSSGDGRGDGAGSNDHGSNEGPGSGQGSNEARRGGGNAQDDKKIRGQGSEGEGHGGRQHQAATTSRAKN